MTGHTLQDLATIVTLADDAIITKDNDDIITSWNPAAVRMFGCTEAEALGLSGRVIVPPGLYADEDAVTVRITRGEVVKHYETSRLHKDGRAIPVSVTVSAMRRPDGQMVGTSMIARDITEARRLEHDARHQSVPCR